MFKQEKKKKRQANLKGTRWYYWFEVFVKTQQHFLGTA